MTATTPPPIRVGKTFVELTVVVHNDDWGTPGPHGTNIPWLMCSSPEPALLLGQEGKAELYRHELSDQKFGVLQNTTSDALAGSFHVWRRDIGMHPKQSRFVLLHEKTDETLARYAAIKRYEPGNDEVRAKISGVAAHRNPVRDKDAWERWNENAGALVDHERNLGNSILFGADMNAGKKTVAAWAHKHDLVIHTTGPRRIDMLITSPEVKVPEHLILVRPKKTSDHNPLIFQRVRIPIKKG